MAGVGVAIGAIIAKGSIGAALIKTGLGLVINFALAKLTAPKQPPPQEVQTEIRRSDAARRRHYGPVRTAGAIMFWEWTSVGIHRRLFKLLAMSTGKVSSFERFWFDEDEVEVDEDGVVRTKPYDPFGNGWITLRTRSGEGQGGDYDTLKDAFTEWTDDHRLDGVATILGEFNAASGEFIAKIYPGGDPTVTALVHGTPCYDPRTGQTEYTENLALQILDVFINEDDGRLTLDSIDLVSWNQAADDCDDQIPIKGAGDPRIGRYHGGGTYELKTPLKDIVRPMLDGCAGRLFRTGQGKIGLRVGKWRDPNYTITEDKIVSIEGGTGSGEFEEITTLVPKYVAPELDYKETSADPWDDEEVIALIGETEPRELDVLWARHHSTARRLAKIQMAKLNPKWRFTVELRFWGLLLLEEEKVYLNYPARGINNEPFWIDRFSFDPENQTAPVLVELIHASRESFEWDKFQEGEPPSTPPDTQPEDTTQLPEPVILSVEVEDAPVDQNTFTSNAKLKIKVEVDAQYELRGDYAPDNIEGPEAPEDQWRPLSVNQKAGVLRSDALQDRQRHKVRIAYFPKGFTSNDEFTPNYAEIDDIDVAVNGVVPSAPNFVSASVDGGQITVEFEPDLGANYWRTQLRRGPVPSTFNPGTVVWNNYASTPLVTITATHTPGEAYWLVSQNYSGDDSGITNVTIT